MSAMNKLDKPELAHFGDMWPCYDLLAAQIWQEGVDRPNAIIPNSMWAR